jgi:tetratricopeptide (TPR) repeat protein
MRVEVALLGGFTVSIDGVALPPDRWTRRRAAALVKLLALAPHARLHRDRVTDALWPDVGIDAALPRLYKAAHYARQALRIPGAVVVREEVVALCPAATVRVDVVAFETAADAALRAARGSTDAYQAAIALYSGELLPDDLNEMWSEEPRGRLRLRYEQLLRGVDPTGDWSAAPREREPVPASAPAAVNRSARAGWDAAHELLERENELGVLSRLVRSVVRTGRGSVVLVTGEAGSGKSALTRALIGRLDEDLVVAMGGCDDLLAPRSLGPFRDMAEKLPDLASILSRAAQAEDILPALLRYLSAAPSILVLEDVHWADDATLDAIRYLSRRITAIPAVLLLTFRDEDIGATHPLRRVLGSLSGSSTRRIELAALSVDAVRRLAGGDEEEAAEIHRVTRGNPFFVTEVLDADRDGVPATVRDAVLGRIGRLPSAARRLAELIAVVPSRTERWLAEALAGDEPGALVHLERAGVVSGGPDYVSFRHELARQAIELSLTVGELVQANRAVIDALLGRPRVEPSRIIHHAVPALRTDLLLRHGPSAAADAERDGAHRQAAETLRVVLTHAEHLDQSEHANLLTRRAYSLYVVNEYNEALPCAVSAVAVAERSQNPLLLAEALMVLSRIALFARGPTTARQAAARAVAILEKLDDEARLAAALIELARTHSNLATVGIVAQPDPAVVRHTERALALGDRLRRDDLRAQALWYRGSGRLAEGDLGGSEDIERAIALTATESRLETRVRGYVNAAGSAYRAGRHQEAHRYVGEGLRHAADGEFAAGEYRLYLTSAAVSASQGDWDRAIAVLRRLVSGPGQPGTMGLLAQSLLARLLGRRGDPEASAILDEATRDPVWMNDSSIAGPLSVALVEVAWLAGTADEIPSAVWNAVELAARARHTAIHAELCGYLRRAGHQVTAPADAPGPWNPALAGRWREAAAAWHALGERYEQAVEQACSADDPLARAAGMAALAGLGATATLARVRDAPPLPKVGERDESTTLVEER